MVNGRCMQVTTGFLTVSHRIKRLTRPSKPANGFSLAVKGGIQTRRMKIRRELHSGEGKECDLSMGNAPYPLIHRDYDGVNPPWAQSDSASVKIIAFFGSLFILLLFFDLPLEYSFLLFTFCLFDRVEIRADINFHPGCRSGQRDIIRPTPFAITLYAWAAPDRSLQRPCCLSRRLFSLPSAGLKPGWASCAAASMSQFMQGRRSLAGVTTASYELTREKALIRPA